MIHRGNEGRYETSSKIRIDGRVDGYDEFRWRQMMTQGSRNMAMALGVEWPCDHLRTPENTLTIGGKQHCRTCRRRRWNRGFRAVCARREDTIARLKQAHKMRGVILACDKAMVHQYLHNPGEGRLPLKLLVEKVSDLMGLECGALIGTKRATASLRDGRAIIFRILRDRGLSYPVIGEAMGGKDHSTIIYALEKFETYMARSDVMAWTYNEVKDKPNGQS